nr:MAG TPA: hypothetical protein [Caudoviricetes sp.]
MVQVHRSNEDYTKVMVPLPDRAVRCRIEITFIYSDYAEANRRSKQHFISADASNEEESSKKLTL